MPLEKFKENFREFRARLKLLTKQLGINANLVYVLIAANILLFLVSIGLRFFLPQPNQAGLTYTLLGAQSPELIIQHGQIWRLLISAFLHTDLIHIVFNMIALYQLGLFTERFFSAKKLLITYVLTAIFASLVSIAVNFVTRENPFSIGASGAIFGIMGLLLGNMLINKRYSANLPLDRNQLILIILYNLMFGFMPNVPVDNAAHIGGLLSGFLLSFFIDPMATFDYSKAKERVMKALSVLCSILLILAFTAQIIYDIRLLTEIL
jgi:rhomboid protease GluP